MRLASSAAPTRRPEQARKSRPAASASRSTRPTYCRGRASSSGSTTATRSTRAGSRASASRRRATGRICCASPIDSASQFTDNSINLGPLGTSGTLDVVLTLTADTKAAGAGFGADFPWAIREPRAPTRRSRCTPRARNRRTLCWACRPSTLAGTARSVTGPALARKGRAARAASRRSRCTRRLAIKKIAASRAWRNDSDAPAAASGAGGPLRGRATRDAVPAAHEPTPSRR